MAQPQRDGRDTTLRRVVGLFGPYRGRVAVVAATIVATSLLGIVNPYLTREVFDRALFGEGGPDLDLLTVLVTAMIAVTLVASGIGVWQTHLTNGGEVEATFEDGVVVLRSGRVVTTAGTA